MITMVEETRITEEKKSNTRKLRELPSINLASYKKDMILVLNPWPEDRSVAEKERQKLVSYKILKALAKEKEFEKLKNSSWIGSDAEDRSDLRRMIEEASQKLSFSPANLNPEQLGIKMIDYFQGSSSLVKVHQVIEGFSENGLSVLNGIAGKVFDTDESREYNASKRILLDNGNTPPIEMAAKSILKKHETHNQTKKEIIDAARTVYKFGENALNLSHGRYESLEDLLHLEGVLGVRGDSDFSSWDLAKKDGVEEFEVGDKMLKVAYFSLPNEGNTPDFLIGTQYHAQTRQRDLKDFLINNDFDVLVYNGKKELLEHMIKDVNKDHKITTGGFFSSRTVPKIRNKIVVISDPRKGNVSVDYSQFEVPYDKGHMYNNLFIEGVNAKDNKLLLLDVNYSANTTYIGVVSPPLGILGEEKLAYASAVFHGARYDTSRGVLTNVDFVRRESVGESTSTFSSLTSTALKMIKGKDKTETEPAKPGCLRALVPYIIGGAIGAGAMWGYYENKIIPGFKDIYTQYRQIIQDMRSK